jgi:hypothetical protein
MFGGKGTQGRAQAGRAVEPRIPVRFENGPRDGGYGSGCVPPGADITLTITLLGQESFAPRRGRRLCLSRGL